MSTGKIPNLVTFIKEPVMVKSQQQIFSFVTSQSRDEVWKCADSHWCHLWHYHRHKMGLVSLSLALKSQFSHKNYFCSRVSKCQLDSWLIIINLLWFANRVDQAGVICQQEGIFRVNCMDCLDRTNVVQAAIARVVMEQQVQYTNSHLILEHATLINSHIKIKVVLDKIMLNALRCK